MLNIKKSRLFDICIKNSRMKRYLDDLIARDLTKKMVFVTGPRQVGKTTLSRLLLDKTSGQYLNYDLRDDRAVILR